jgi:hypothetical protein
MVSDDCRPELPNYGHAKEDLRDPEYFAAEFERLSRSDTRASDYLSSYLSS